MVAHSEKEVRRVANLSRSPTRLTPTPDTNSPEQQRSAPDPSGWAVQGRGRLTDVTDIP